MIGLIDFIFLIYGHKYFLKHFIPWIMRANGLGWIFALLIQGVLILIGWISLANDGVSLAIGGGNTARRCLGFFMTFIPCIAFSYCSSILFMNGLLAICCSFGSFLTSRKVLQSFIKPYSFCLYLTHIDYLSLMI